MAIFLISVEDIFKMKMVGKHEFMKNSRFDMLIEAGVDFYAGDCSSSPNNVANLNEVEALLSSSNTLKFPENTHSTGDECERKSFTHFSAVREKLGHSLVLPYDDETSYWWIVDKRWQSIQHHANSGMKQQPLSIFTYITGNDLCCDERENQSSLLWTWYCERLMIFKGETSLNVSAQFHCMFFT